MSQFKELGMQTVIPLLKQLSEAQGITGFEQPVCELLRQTWSPFVDEMHVGKLGSLIALKKGGSPEPIEGSRPKLMLAAHMDEIGLRVTGVEDGFLHVTRVGGTDRRVLLGLEVVVHATRASREGRDLPGIIATRPPHVLPEEERKKTVDWDKIFVDVGLPPQEVERLVSIGDLISFRREVAELKNRRLAGKAFDDRACVAIVTLALEQLTEMRHDWDVFAVATVQEEIGLKGAVASAYGVAPDLAVALDVTFGKQPGVLDVDSVPLGEGPVISVGPNFHPGAVARLKEVAEAREIPYQLEPAPGRSGTDAWAIQVTHDGVPTALISLPLRYMHQPVETLDTRDVERAARLLAAFVAGLEADFLDKLTLDLNGATEGRQ
jgi:putative aminopeptidase FrvX